MARLTHPDTAGSQFFICLDDAPHLDGGYAAFARMLRGFDALERIEAAGSKGGVPTEPITLERVVIRERKPTDTPTASHDS
jgi:peptidyl-prolyl cis-trans isomerase B (cyclophilin B)